MTYGVFFMSILTTWKRAHRVSSEMHFLKRFRADFLFQTKVHRRIDALILFNEISAGIFLLALICEFTCRRIIYKILHSLEFFGSQHKPF